MRYRKLPIELKFRVHEYYYQRYHGQLFDEDMILCELSQALKEVNWMLHVAESRVYCVHSSTIILLYRTGRCEFQLPGIGQSGSLLFQR